MEVITIKTVEMHTGGEPVRIVPKGQMDIKGDTVLDKIKYCKENLDHIRKLLIFEPRGHYDMYGVYLVDSDQPGADVGCIFVHNEGYATMCGHATISLGRYLVDNKLVREVTSPETRVVLQCPCGNVEVFVETDGQKSGDVRFRSVPSFVSQLGGEPLRLVPKGQIDIKGDTLLDKMKYCKENLDLIRKQLILEPRGDPDMFGVYLVDTDLADSDIGCIFVHNEGYSTICGHATISLGRYLVDNKLVREVTSPETKVVLQCPCGNVEVFVETDGQKSGDVRFRSVQYVSQLDLEVSVPDLGRVTVDVVFGGAFYAIVPMSRIGVDLNSTETEIISRKAFAVTKSVQKAIKVSHPEHSDMEFVYGTIVTDGKDEFSEEETRNMCVFADREVDRSPCGSGVCARIALQYARGQIKPGQVRTFRSPSGATFRAQVYKTLKYGGYDTVVVEVAGRGYYTGKCEFTLEAGDEIGRGFLLK